MPFTRRLIVLLALVALGGCASTSKGPSDQDVQRATEGPTAQEVFMSRFATGYARVPSFDETAAFRMALDERVMGYLARHPDISTSPRASQFTFHRRVNVGMTKEEVVVLAGPPVEMTESPAKMSEAARQFWDSIKPHAKEMWVYPGGWRFYFDGDELVDLTVFGKEPL